MSNQRQCHVKTMGSRVRRKWSWNACLSVRATILATAILTLTTTISLVASANLEPQIKLLINDEALLLQQPKQAANLHVSADIPSSTHGSVDEEQQHHYNMYRSSELRRLSYETIHRILRDENEPIYRREDAEMRYYQKRSYQPTHEVFRRSAVQPMQQLNLTRSNLTALPAAVTTGNDYQLLQTLDLSFNELREVNLKHFPLLQTADLSHNQLTALPPIENSTLKMLNLNDNGIKFAKAPTNCTHLIQLHLSANDIENLSALNLSALTSLETLDLSCNHIENLETAFFPQRMHNLKFLNLARNRLGSIYRETFYNLLSLNTLILTHNNITDIDYETFLALPNLQYLDLSHNQLRGESIRALQGIPDLVGLSIAYNSELGGFMQEFVASWSLKELDASGTGLCQIPAALAQSVRTLKLTDNWLKIINCGDLDSYPLLQYLDLSNSRIEDIEDDALGRLEILEVLFLDNNNLHKVPLSLPTSLQHLFLQHNQIMDIQVQAFQGLNNLQTLDLSGNKLLYLPALPLPKLLTLNLQSSELRGLNQAIVHTLPRLRDMLLEDNPIKCSDLLGMAEWASPCRIGELTATVTEESDVGGGSVAAKKEAELGQQQAVAATAAIAKIDLKQHFVQMHNFFQNFKTNCGASGQQQESQPPACAIELEAEADVDEFAAITTTADAAEVITFNLPTEPQIQGSSNNEKVYDNQQEIRNTAAATEETLQSAQNNEANMAVAAATIMRASNTPTSSHMASTTKTLLESVASAMTEITAATTLATNPTMAAARTINAADTKDANHVELDRTHLKGINSEDASMTMTTKITTRAAAAAAVNSKQQQQPLKTATTNTVITKSTFNASGENAEPSNSNKSKSVAAIKTTTATAVGGTLDTQAATTTTEETTIYMMPQTISTTIKSASNYVETTTPTMPTTTATKTTSLLSQQGLKTSAAVYGAKNDSSNNNSNNKATDIPKQQQRQQKFNGISGQQHIDAEPTKPKPMPKRILATEQQQQIQQEQKQQQQQQQFEQHTGSGRSNNASHRHEPLQLHIKDRHLIGTPLLMHKGHNILVDPEQLMLAVPATATTTNAQTAVTMTTMAAKLDTQAATASAIVTRTTALTAGKGSRPDTLDGGQKQPTELKEPHLLAASTSEATERDKLPATEAIKSATNEPAMHEATNAAEWQQHGKLAKTTRTNEMTSTNGKKFEDSKGAQLHAAKTPKGRGADKKKLSLTMKKMTITKQAGTQQQQATHQHQYLKTPRRENDAAVTGDWQLFKELKTELSGDKQIEPPLQLLHPDIPPHKPHSNVNTPVNAEHAQHGQEALPQPQLAAVEQQGAAQHAVGISKTEQWLDERKPVATTGHPGLVILVSCIAVIVLLLGLIQVYRCDKPWQQRAEVRPHQRPLNDEDSGNSFLSYHNHQQQQQQLHKWHHSTRLLPPHRSPLHSLHVRELQKSCAVAAASPPNRANETQTNIRLTLASSNNSATSSSNSSSSCSSHTSHISNSHYSSTGAIMEDDAFYIEMTPDSGQTTSNLHSDLLPMELLSVSTNRRATDKSPEWAAAATTLEATESNEEAVTAGVVSQNDSAACSETRLPLVQLAPTTTRKLGLW